MDKSKTIKMLWVCLMMALGLASCRSLNETKIVENIKGSPCTDKNHLFLAPGVLTAGSMNRACVSRFFTEGPAHLMLSMLTEDRVTVTVSTILSGDGGCLDIIAPSLPNTKADLIVKIMYPETSCVWERRVPLRISSGRVLVLSTERARYRPGELLRLRVLALRQELAPSHGVIDEVWLEGPQGAWEGSRVTQWQRVRTRLGLALLQYQFDELAPSGKWTLRAKLADGTQGSTMFWVGNYELPPFQLSVRHAPKVLRTSERMVWHVCVRYPWSEAVEGMLVIRLRGAGGGSGGIRTAVQIRAPKACHRHAAASKRVGLDGPNPPDVVIADFSFQEEGTRIWQNTTVVSQVVDKPISLEFLTKHRAVISPGLPYKLKVKATRWDDKPASKALVRVCRYPSTHPAATTQATLTLESMCAEGTTDANGVARLLFAAGDDAAPFYRFEAQLSNDTTISAVPLSLPVRRSSTVHAALGPLKPDPRQSRTFVPLYLNTNSTNKPYTVHFVVITRGGVIYRWGATTQCPTSNSADQIRTAPRNSKCNVEKVQKDVVMAQLNVSRGYIKMAKRHARLPSGIAEFPKHEAVKSKGSHDVLVDTSFINSSADISDALLDRHQLRVMLPIKVSHQMCPDSHVIAYFYHDGELISASKHIDMDECFVNKVEATWLSRQVQPGSNVSLQISTPGPALCGLSVLDTAAKWPYPPNSPKDQLLTSLKRLIDSRRNLTVYDIAGVCFFNSDSPDLPSSSIELTASWMASAGVRLLGGDLPPGSRPCIARPPAPLVAEETTIPRSDFSEAWLWRLLNIDANGTGVAEAKAPDSITKFEASAICVSRNGVAISSPAVLQVFREFFIHADGPKRILRGDSTIIRYRIFNYLYEPLSVQIQILPDSNVEGPQDLVQSACVGARASVARRVRLRARRAGPARLGVRAKAVSDGNCGNVTSGRTGVSDEVIIRFDVDPEGVPIKEQKSILLCGNSSAESSKSEVNWNWPAVEVVPDSETLTVWAVGDVTGPLLADADSLLTIPRGCGEQNMAQLATNLLALNQLEPTSIAALTAKENVARGFTRQLQYVHPSGGFSAFGSSDAISSTWLTAFAVKHMRRAHKLLWPDLQAPPAIIRAERWLLSQQMENGCFRNEGQVFHRELKGGLNDEGEIVSVALTAYVITSLIDSSSPLPHSVIVNTLSCLRAFPPLKSKTPTRVYAQALLAYAFMKLKDYEEDLKSANEANLRRTVGGVQQEEGIRQILELLKLARRSGDYVWWEASSLSSSIEATSYALLALHSAPRALAPPSRADAPGAARWLHAHRSTSGGFVSTQDTLVALEALTTWSYQATETNLNVTARCSKMDHHVTVKTGVKIPEVMKMNPGESLNVSVKGTGCALVQATRAYNILSADQTLRDKKLSVQVSVHTDGPFDCDDNSTNCYCAAVIEACVMWVGSFPEMALLEVTLPGGFGADAKLLYSQLHKRTTLLRRIELTPSSTRATFYLGTRDGSDTSGHAGHQCYKIHATGPKVKTRPSYAKIQDYYAPTINDTQIYSIPEECPPRIMHESNEYHVSDNLYNKARAISGDDIIITHDFSFDDIPEGIPLDDPLMFDHMTENENYRAIVEKHPEIGKLEEPKDAKDDSKNVLHHNISDYIPSGQIWSFEPEDQSNSFFGNVFPGYFSEPVKASISMSMSIDEDNHFSGVGDVVGSFFGVNKGTITEHKNFNHVIAETNKVFLTQPLFKAEVGNNLRINDNTEKDQSNVNITTTHTSGNDSHVKDNIGKTDKMDTDGNGVSENSKPKPQVEIHIATITGSNNSNQSNVSTAKDVYVKEDSANDNINQKNNTVLNFRLNVSSVHDYNNFHNIAIGDGNKASVNNHNYFYNIATENSMSNIETEIDRENSYSIDSEYKQNELKVDTLKNDLVGPQSDRRNNILQDIEFLNKVAHKQLNKTKAKINSKQAIYKGMYSHEDNGNVIKMQNQDTDNTVDNYHHSEALFKSEDKEVKRSYKEADGPVPVIPELPKKKNRKYKVGNNPNFANFHVIDTEKDLEVPAGVLGPVPNVVLPPPNFAPPAPESRRIEYTHRPTIEPNPSNTVATNFVKPQRTYGPFKMKSLPPQLMDFGNDGLEKLYKRPPPDFPLPPNFGKLDKDSAPDKSVHRLIAPVSPPENVDIGKLESIDTPYGRYFYFKSNENTNINDKNKQLFMPEN